MKVKYILPILVISLLGCKTQKNINNNKEAEVEIGEFEIEPLDDEVEKAAINVRPLYHAAETRINDLLHTKLDVRFNWEQQHLYGKANLIFKPYFYATDSLILDAKGFDIHKVELANGTKLKYSYDKLQLKIQLDKTYSRNDKYEVYIEYTAKPEELEVIGSSAIASDKGLYFINPLNEDPFKRQQIWTQGETEASSCWFPTIDAPNERTTQEIYITVKDKYVTLSNGVKVMSIKNNDGTRTDYWKQDQPHAPYLFMMGIGEFEIIEDSWKNKEGKTIPVNYYVEKEYAPYAKSIFGETPRMMTYFSDLLGVEYPWDKYHQIVVRDYVSGAMENTTAVIHGDFLYRTDRELLDEHNESIIAHELFHHWFGDLVTCESWSNLPLNESFANYSQYLWDEYAHGRKEADYYAYDEMHKYILSTSGGHHNLIWYDYDSKEDMFDTHSYNKGGRILHMLRKYVGDEAFFVSLKHYLNKMQYKAAEAADLRLSFEEITGEDLNWFFNQWFFDDGHPKLNFSHTYDSVSQMLSITVEQKQKFEKFPVYKLPIDVDIYTPNKKTRKRIIVTKDVQTFHIKTAKPLLVNMDAEKVLLGKIKEEKSENEWIYQLNNAPLYLDKKKAIEKLKYSKNTSAQAAILNATNDDFWGLKILAMKNLKRTVKTFPEKTKATLLNLTDDKVAAVRANALKYLHKYFKSDGEVYKKAEELAKDESFKVIEEALLVVGEKDSDKVLEMAKGLEQMEEKSVISAVSSIYVKHGTSKQHEYFIKSLSQLGGFEQISLINKYGEYLKRQDSKEIDKAIPILSKLAKDSPIWITRLVSINTFSSLQEDLEKRIDVDKNKLKNIDVSKANELQEVRNQIMANENLLQKLDSTIENIVSKETNPQVLQYLGATH